MSHPAPTTVLIVDDNPDLLQMLTFALKTLGEFTIVQADDGIRGLEQAVAVQPDCMVIDVMMPGLDGYQLVRALRGDPATASIPLILLTALVQEKNYFAGVASGADYYLTKPTSPQRLIETIQHAIAISQAERAQRFQSLADAPPDDQAKGKAS